MDETTNDSRQDPIERLLASGTASINPFIPTAVSADTGSQSPFFIDAAKQAEDFNITQQIQRGQAGVKFLGNYDDYEWYQDKNVDPNKLGNLGFEHQMKYSSAASKGWGEQNTYARDNWLRWMKGESSNYFWNPADLNDMSNEHNHTSWWSAMGDGVGKWFVDQAADEEFQHMKDRINTEDPLYTNDIKVKETDEFLQNNTGVSRVLVAGGVDLHDYTRNAKNKFGTKFAINNAVIDALQNIRLKKWDENNQSFFGAGKLVDMLSYGIQDPLLVRDMAVTTALTLGLGTLEVGAARLAAGLGEATVAGARAMRVAKTASSVLQLTSPFTGMVEGPVYKSLQTLIPNVGKSGIKTMMARGLAIGTEAGIQGGLAAYQDQRNEYNWKNLVLQNQSAPFTPEWTGVAQGAATGFGAGGLMLGLMRFGLGALSGEAKLLRSGKMKEYWQGIAHSLDTWAKTDKGLTVFGNELSGGRGIAFGDMVDRYMKNNVDNRDFASIMLNGTKMYSNAVFSPEIAAKSGFDEKAATKIADTFAESTGLPGEVIQKYAPEHPVRVFFDNLMDPEYMERSGLTYADTHKIMETFNNRRAGILGPSEIALAGTNKAIQDVRAKENLVALAQIFELDRVHRIVQRAGLTFDTVAEAFKKATGEDLDFGVESHRSNFSTVADYSAANKGLLEKHMDVLSFARSGEKLKDYVNPDGVSIDGAVLRDSLRKTLGLDERTGRLFITDSYAGTDPNFIISIEPDGTMNRHATKLVTENGVVKVYNEITKSSDYVAENIKTAQDMKEAFGQLSRDVKAIYEEKKAARVAKAKDELKKISDKADSKTATPKEKEVGEKVRKAWQDIGRLPTRKILEKHFNLSSAEAAAAEIVMDTLGHDVEGMILKIARSEKFLADRSMNAALQWESIESGVRALIRTGQHSDFGSLIHEMGHYNRAIFIGNTPESKAFRHKIGISDELWKKFLKWSGNEDEIWLGSPEAIKLQELASKGDAAAKEKLMEITKAEEKFATAWHHYVRSVMVGDGKTKATGLHRLFSAMGDHLGDLGKKMELQGVFEKELTMTPEAKEVFEKLFLRSENNLTKFWDNASANIFKNMDPSERAKLGEYILGTELWNTHKAKTEAALEKAAKTVDPVVKTKVKKTKMSDIVDSIKSKVSGSAFEPTKKSIHSALKAGKTIEHVEAGIAKIRSMLEDPSSLPAHEKRPKAPDNYFASHVKGLSDEQLSALPDGKILKPIEGVVTWFYNENTKELDVSFPVVTTTKELIEKELQRRKQNREALKKLGEATSKQKTAEKTIAEVTSRVKDTGSTRLENMAEAAGFVANVEFAMKNNSISELQVETLKQKLKGVVDKESGEAFNRWLLSHPNKAMGTLLELYSSERFSKDSESFAKLILSKLEKKPGEEASATSAVAAEVAKKEQPILAEAIKNSVEATHEIESIKTEIEKTDIVVPKENEEITPEAALAEVKETVDPKYVDESGTPVVGLTAEEKVVLDSTQTRIDDVVTEEKQLAQTVINAADDSVPVGEIVKPVERVESKKVNVEKTSTPSTSRATESAAVVVRELRKKSDDAASNIPTEVLDMADEAIEVYRIDPESRKDLIRTILDSSSQDIRNGSIPELEKMLETYFDRRARFLIAEDALSKFGSMTEEEKTRWNSIPPSIKDALENDGDIDLINLHPENKDLPYVVANRHGVNLEGILFFADIKKRRQAGLIAAASEKDAEVMSRHEKAFKAFEDAEEKLQTETDQEKIKELEKILNANEEAHGIYRAAAERRINRELHGSSIHKLSRTTVADKTIDEIFAKGKTVAAENLSTPIVTDREMRRLALRQAYSEKYPGYGSEGNIPSLGFCLFESVSDARTAPGFTKTRIIKKLNNRSVDLGLMRLVSTLIVSDLLSEKPTVNSLMDILTYAMKYTTQDAALAEVKKLGNLSIINNNPVLYHSLLAIYAGLDVELTNALNIKLDPDNLGKNLVEINRLVKETKVNLKTAQTTKPMSDVEFAYALIHDSAFIRKVQGIGSKISGDDVRATDLIAKLYRSKGGIKEYFRSRLKLATDISDSELYKAIGEWSSGVQPNKDLANSIKVSLDRQRIDNLGTGKSTKEVSGEAAGDESIGVLGTVYEDQRIVKANAHQATVIDALMSLFYDYLEGKDTVKNGESLQDFFMARVAASEKKGAQREATIQSIKDATGIEVKKDALAHREDKLEKEIVKFFGDLVDDPEIGDNVKEIIKNRFGIGEKGSQGRKSGGIVQGRTPYEPEISAEIRSMVYNREIKNLDQVLEYLSTSDSIFSSLAEELRTTSKKNLKKVKIYPNKVKPGSANAQYSPLLMTILVNDKSKTGFSPKTMIHEGMHAFTVAVLDRIENFEARGSDYLASLQKYIDKNAGDTYNPNVELAEAYIEMVNSGIFKINRDALNDEARLGDMEFYGNINIHEMISEAFTNSEFASRLHEIESTSLANRSVFNKLFDAVVSLFGLQKKDNISLLEKIVLASDDIVKNKGYTKQQKELIQTRLVYGYSSLNMKVRNQIAAALKDDRKQIENLLSDIFKARDDLSSAKGRFNKALGDTTQGRTIISSATEEPKFKEWFGDSKVIKSTSIIEPGSSVEPMMVYHGTGSAGFDEFNSFDFSKSMDHLLFGNGAYFTESPRLASSYAKSKAKSENNFVVGHNVILTEKADPIYIHWVRKLIKDENILNIIDEYYPDNWEVHPRDFFKNLSDEGVEDKDLLEIARKAGIRIEEVDAGVYPVYLSIRNPIDADNSTFSYNQIKKMAQKLNPQDSDKLMSVVDKFWTVIPGTRKLAENLTAIERDNLQIPFDTIFTIVKSWNQEHLFIQSLMKDGYDGLTHIGGLRRGDIEHRVFISWKAGQIKSPFNNGNFDPSISSILGREVIDSLKDAVDLRRRKLAEYGLHEETTMEDINSIHRVLNGLDPVDTSTNKVFDSIKTPMNLSKAVSISKAFDGKTYRSLSESERREFISSSLIPRIREAMGDRNFSAGVYSAVSDTRFGKKMNSLIGGAVQYGDTADSNSMLLQFISKIFDPMMDLRDGELKNKFNIPSVDKLNTEVNNLLLRSEMVQLRDKVLNRVKDQAELKRINDVAWNYMTRESEVPAMINRDLVMETIKVQNKFNELTVDLLSKYGELAKNIDPKTYGTAHVANTYAHQHQKEFVDALTSHAVAKTLERKQISLVTASALGWVEIKRDAHTDNIASIKIEADSPLAVLLTEKEIGKRLEWKGSTAKLFDNIEKLGKDAQEIHNKGLTSSEDYTPDWHAVYSKEGDEYTAIRQSMTIAKNRYLGIDFGDSKSAAPRRMSIGEGRNYTEERIISHDELSRNMELSQFFSKNIFQLANDQLRGSITDAMMTKYLSEFFGTRMSMSDLIQVLSGVGEESIGRSHLSASEVASRKRGYERLRNSWDHSIGNWTSSKDSVDKYYQVLLENSRIPLVAASGLRAAISSVPETARAILSSNKNQSMLRQFMPNMVKLVQLVGPGGKDRRLARQQMISASHWLRGLSTDHMLHRASLHPDNPFAGAVFGQGAGGMISNFINTWKAAGEMNKTETNWLQKASNRLAAFSSAAGAPLSFVNDVTTTLHIWNAQENMTTNIKEFRKMADILAKNPTASYAEFGHLARKCGLAPKEALDLSTAGLLDPKYIDILHSASKNQSLYSNGMLDAKKLFVWAGDDAEKVEAINRMGSYINMTARHTNTEPTLLDLRINQSIFGKSLSQYMQFMLSMGVQEIGRRRRTMTSGYSQHLAGLLLMEAMAYGSSRALADPTNDETGGYDEFVNNPTDFVVRTSTSLPMLGSYAFLSQIMRHAIMGTSEFLGGPGTDAKMNIPDLISGPSSTAPSRLLRTPETIKSWYNLGHDILGEMAQD